MLDINDFKENLVEYRCARLNETQAIWINYDESEALADVMGPGSPDANFARYFSYASPANVCFDEHEFDHLDHRVYFAERYGGRGVGSNGGGGRVGNFGKFQVKGVGPNPVVSEANAWYSYGSLNMVDAASEAIFSTVLDRIMPMGCVKVYGVIHTSDEGALQIMNWGKKDASTAPMPGALLVRELSVRPAHFMHAESFSPPASANLIRESNRIRATHKQLKKRFDTPNSFVEFIGTFILSSSRQFAFARSARIAHGGVSPSNICMDGRWIDLTEARFLSGGKNFTTQIPFYDEPKIISEVITQLVYAYGKVNVIPLSLEPLLRYCEKTFDSCFAYYSLSILGLPETHLDRIAQSENGKAYVKAYASIILKDKRPVSDISLRTDPHDPVIMFMKLSYLGLTGDSSYLRSLSTLLRLSLEEALPVINAFRGAMLESMQAPGSQTDQRQFQSQCIASAIKCLRWSYLSSYFYRGRITAGLYDLVEERQHANVGIFIQECVDESAWIFDKACTGRIIILRTESIDIYFDQLTSTYAIEGSTSKKFRLYDDCLSFISTHHHDARLGATFDPFFYLQGMLDVLSALDNMSHERMENEQDYLSA